MKFGFLYKLLSFPPHCLSKQLFIKKYIHFFTRPLCYTLYCIYM